MHTNKIHNKSKTTTPKPTMQGLNTHQPAKPKEIEGRQKHA